MCIFCCTFAQKIKKVFIKNKNHMKKYFSLLLVLAMCLVACNGKKETAESSEDFSATLATAEQGDATAQNNLGYMYEYGYGVAQDYYEAVKWYRLSAEQGNATGQCSLGYMYEYGYGVAQDYTQAMRWYRQAADQGHTDAIERYYNLKSKGY
jgi:TPR repeat protein